MTFAASSVPLLAPPPSRLPTRVALLNPLFQTLPSPSRVAVSLYSPPLLKSSASLSRCQLETRPLRPLLPFKLLFRTLSSPFRPLFHRLESEPPPPHPSPLALSRVVRRDSLSSYNSPFVVVADCRPFLPFLLHFVLLVLSSILSSDFGKATHVGLCGPFMIEGLGYNAYLEGQSDLVKRLMLGISSGGTAWLVGLSTYLPRPLTLRVGIWVMRNKAHRGIVFVYGFPDYQ